MKGGGLQLYLSEKLNSSKCTVFEEHDVNESIWCKVDTNIGKVLIGMCYRSPSSTKQNNDKLIKILQEAAEQRGIKHVNIFGDFNYPEIDFESQSVNAGDEASTTQFLMQ